MKVHLDSKEVTFETDGQGRSKAVDREGGDRRSEGFPLVVLRRLLE